MRYLKYLQSLQRESVCQAGHRIGRNHSWTGGSPWNVMFSKSYSAMPGIPSPLDILPGDSDSTD